MGDTRMTHPERRVYTASGMPTTEAAIETYGFSRSTCNWARQQPTARQVLRVWYKPYVTLIWLGA
jgi:cytochrome c-type biogenesis protein CcmF